jgi:UTP:GlnB (protein PII) uridylyltransferase
MPSRVLTNEELGKARELLDDIRQRLLTLSNDDKDLLFAYRRKIGKELIYDERSHPSVRRKLKRSRWLDEIVSGSVTDVQQIASRQKCSVRQVNMTISLAFLAPDLVRAAVEGRLPRGIGVERLRDAPAESRRQFEALGLNPR